MHAAIRKISCFKVVIAGITLITTVNNLSGQNNAFTKRADSLFALNQWEKANKEYMKAQSSQPDLPYNYYKAGKSQFNLKKYTQALSFFQTAVLKGSRPAVILNVAECFLLLNKKDSAYIWLQKLASGGFTDYKLVESDSIFYSITSEDKFIKIIKSLRINFAPCTANPAYRQFDFWIGEWNVTSKGMPAGKSSIRLILDSCVIFENWTGMKEGKSFNMYDAQTNTWKQTWVDYSGAWTEFINGEYKDGKMTFHTQNTKQPDGSFALKRLTFFNIDNNHVRQFSEISKDEGKTWSVEYDFMYTRI